MADISNHFTFQMGADTGEANTHKQIIQQFDFLQRCTQETENDLRQLQQKQESLIIQYQEIQKVNGECKFDNPTAKVH